MINWIRNALAVRRLAMLEAEALVLRFGDRAEAVAMSRAAGVSADDRTRAHFQRVARIARGRHDLLRGLDTATRYAEVARWRSRAGQGLP